MTEPQLCMTVAGPSMEELRRSRDAATDADLVELRLDLVDRPDVAGALAGRRVPVVVTCRASWEGGQFQGSEEERRRILESALELGAEYIDVEAEAGFAPDLIRVASRPRHRPVVALLWRATFGSADRYARLRASGAEVAKLAIQVTSLEETLPIFELGTSITDEPGRGHVLLAMGNQGVPTRVLAARLRNRWTYAGNAVAPGQLPASRLLADYRFRRIASDAALYAVVGNPIIHSRSPVMHNAGFAALGLNAVYVPLEARDSADFITFAERMNLRGASITTPFKIALMRRADEIDPLARQVGAINTVTVRNGRWSGTNTDVEGFLAPLLKRTSLEGRGVTVLGSGGAARAVAVALGSRRATVTVFGAQRARRERHCCDGRRLGRGVAAAGRELGCARQRDDGRKREDAGQSDGRRAARWLHRVRPRLRTTRHGAPAVGPCGRVPDDRWPRDAHRPGRASVRVVDGTTAAVGALRSGGDKRRC